MTPRRVASGPDTPGGSSNSAAAGLVAGVEAAMLLLERKREAEVDAISSARKRGR